MNFLAHAYLAQSNTALIVGGVIGDWIKGPLESHVMPPDVLRGVALHRAIDAFADREPAFLRSRSRISPLRRRWSGVLVDMFYDHLLAKYWDAWHTTSLHAFSRSVYAALQAEHAWMPSPIFDAMQLMGREDWLGSYRTRTGLSTILERMGRRSRQPNPLAESAAELEAIEAALYEDLAAFLPAAQNFVADWISQSPPSAASV